jgi:peroxiredoxin Q/BCP
MRETRPIIINKGAVMADLTEGGIPPDFELPKAGGGTGSLAEHAGKPLVLYFFCKDGGDACVNEAKDFSRLKREFDGIGVDVVGISPDGAKSKERFRAKHDVTVDLLSDETRRTAEDYGVWKRKEHVRADLHGRRAHDVPDRSGGQDRKDLAKGSRRRPCGGSSRRGQGIGQGRITLGCRKSRQFRPSGKLC